MTNMGEAWARIVKVHILDDELAETFQFVEEGEIKDSWEDIKLHLLGYLISDYHRVEKLFSDPKLMFETVILEDLRSAIIFYNTTNPEVQTAVVNYIYERENRYKKSPQ